MSNEWSRTDDVERSGDDGSQPGSLSFLSYSDVRRFGRIAVVDAGEYGELPTLATLGPEPFDDTFTPEGLRSALNGSRRAVKTQLLSQRVVAGVGNIYADEALWHAQVHPAAKRITRRQAQDLRDSIRAVLWSGITHGGTTLRDYRDASGSEGSNQHQLVCYGRVGKPCHRCGSPLRRLVVDARSSTLLRSVPAPLKSARTVAFATPDVTLSPCAARHSQELARGERRCVRLRSRYNCNPAYAAAAGSFGTGSTEPISEADPLSAEPSRLPADLTT